MQTNLKATVTNIKPVPKMKPEFKKLWLEALRSGDYKQTDGKLRKVDEETKEIIGFCCLGVACDILQKQGKGEWNGGQFAYDGFTNDQFLVEGARDEIGLSSDLGYVYAKELEEDEKVVIQIGDKKLERFSGFSLAALNDNEGLSFKEIAAVIEEVF